MNAFLCYSLASLCLFQINQKEKSDIVIRLSDGKMITPVCLSSTQETPRLVRGDLKAGRLADRKDKAIKQLKLESSDAYGLHYSLSTCENKCGSDVVYTRLILTLTNTTKDPIGIDRVSFFTRKSIPPSFKILGETDGNVATFEESDGTTFLAIEHPMAKMEIDKLPEKKWDPEIFEKRVWEFPVDAKGGDLTLSFHYTDGAHRADIERVEALGTGIKDEHRGFAGLIHSNSVYTLKNMKPGKATIRVIFTYEKYPYFNQSYGTVYLTGVRLPKSKTASAWLPIADTLKSGETLTCSAVIGKVREHNQLRRAFLTYLEEERAYPFRVYPHYNSWYDLGLNCYEAPWNQRMNEAQCLDTVRSVGGELKKRGEYFNSFLWDDGWDNWDSFWDFHPGFPNKFDRLAREAKKNNSAISAWMSPCGGYGNACAHRVAYAKKIGIAEPSDSILNLHKPIYYKAFRSRCLEMIDQYGMDIFKFDRLGSGNNNCVGGSASFAPQVRAVLSLIQDLRKRKSDIFVNATVGTWASPFWLRWTDSIWRGGLDWGSAGPGPVREGWITYRDDVTHDRIVKGSPLFPLTGLMAGGVVISQYGPAGGADRSFTEASTRSVNNEIWMMAASGIGLQEYYISDNLMCPAWWDTIAKAIHWSRENEQTLRDNHWIGGDPLAGSNANVYGYAALGNGKGVITLRNPSDHSQTFEIHPDTLLEMPAASCGRKIQATKAVYCSLQRQLPKFGMSSDIKVIELKPFEVVIFELLF